MISPEDNGDGVKETEAVRKRSSVKREAVVLPTRIRVVVRVRPKLSSEASHSTEILQVHQQRNTVQCASSATAKSFQFDQVYDGSTPQRHFYEHLGVDRMLQAVLDGYHATIFAYGQTGSGKTFTMEGYDYEKTRESTSSTSERGAMPQARFESSSGSDRIGLIPRAIFTLFELIARASRDASREFVVKCSFLQIYNEQILDLFNPSHFLHAKSKSKPPPAQGAGARAAAVASKNGGAQGLRLRWSAVRDFYVENLRVLECTSPDHVLQHFQDGIKHKIMASHNLNAASSRSHCIFTLYVESFDPLNNPNEVLHSKLALVDLAGSERVDKTGATGVTLQESIGINKSLFVLRQVIQALSEETSNQTSSSKERSYIPYRDSKLTSLLKYSLGGNSWTLMVACLSPSDSYVDENLSTLLYAAKAQSIANNPTKNEDPKTVLIHELKQEVESLRRQLSQAQDIILQFQQQRPPSGDEEPQKQIERLQSIQPEGTPVTTASNQQTSVGAVSEPKVASVAAETKTTAKLKMSVIDNVEMIKQLYLTEKQLTDRVRKQEAHISDLQHETRVLHAENQSLREKLEVLEYLLATQPPDPAHHEGGDDSSEAIDDIPGYGTLGTMATGTNSLPLLPPSAERIQQALGKPPARSTRTPNTRATQGSSNQEQQPRQPSRPPHTGSTAPKTAKKKEAETGLLSLSELRDLLGGKKLNQPTASAETATAPERRSSSRPSTNPPLSQSIPVLVPPQMGHDENPTASILAMLQRQKQETGRSSLEKDPLESLSELNRLLRVKATLRRSSSYK